MSDVRTGTIETRIPARLDRLPWSRFHWLVIVGLGTVWILDGLEVTIVGSVASRLTEDGSGISISPGQIGVAAAIYVAGACLGALFFGQLTDRFGRKKLFVLTLAIYITATVATAFAFAPWYFFVCRFFTGAGIGGEYAAINSAIDELIPARVRGRVDLMINGSYWLGSAAGSAAALLLLDTAIFAKDFGWRLAFGLGAVLGLTIMLVRRNVPESPRWLFIHGREDEAERIVDDIEEDVREESGEELSEPDESMEVRQRESIPFREIARVAFKLHPKRAVLGLSLFVGQAFMYNALTFDLGTILGTFFGVASATVPVFVIIYAFGNFLGPMTLGRLFDTVGRKPMISGCYLGSAALTVVLAFLLLGDTLGRWTFLALIVGIFFLASAGASAAYLTVSEIFPMETRALAIAFFYAVGTAVGGITGPLLFGHLIGSGERSQVAIGFFIGAGVMALGGIVELMFGVKAEQQKLEDIAEPLTVGEAEEEDEAQADREGAEAEEDEEPDREPAPAQRCRAEAEEERARAAEHRATVHELRSRRAEDRDDDRAAVEETLARIAELRAASLDQRAEAHDARAQSDGDGADRAAAEERARAAEERADSLRERAEALAASDESETRRHEQLAEAARERGRAREQSAAAEEAAAEMSSAEGPRADLAAARRDMHERRFEKHETLARVHEARAAGGGDRGDDGEERARELEEHALAAEQRVEAAEHRVSAEEAGGRADETEDAARRREEDAERRRRAREREEEVRRRAAARIERERRGARRFRPGPGSRLHAPGVGASTATVGEESAETLEREIDAIARALDEHGTLDRGDLAHRVGARYWGPGRFTRALREGVADGRIARVSRRSYAGARRAED
jgi:MFS family permease